MNEIAWWWGDAQAMVRKYGVSLADARRHVTPNALPRCIARTSRTKRQCMNSGDRITGYCYFHRSEVAPCP